MTISRRALYGSLDLIDIETIPDIIKQIYLETIHSISNDVVVQGISPMNVLELFEKVKNHIESNKLFVDIDYKT